MLRFSLLLLLLANGGYFAWSQGWMASLGWTPQVQSEPQRLKQQVRPDVLRVLPQPEPPPAAAIPEPVLVAVPQPAAETPVTVSGMQQMAGAAPVSPAAPEETVAPATAATAATVHPEPALCLQAGSFDELQSKVLEQAVRKLSLPAGSWEMVPTQIAGRWMVYLGKFANETAMEKRRAELRSRKISFDRAGGNLDPGLSLGRFSTEEAATRELAHMQQLGVKGARVVQERAASTVYTLRLPHVTATQRQALESMEPALLDKTLRRCAG